MSNNRNNNWDFDDEDDDDEFQPVTFTQEEENSPLVRQLRKQLKAEKKRAKELETKYQDLTVAQKERILKDVLTSRGLNPKIASYVPADVETSPDAINAWLDSNGDVFGIKASDKPSIPEGDINELQKMDRTITGAESSSSSDSIEMRLANATSEEEILSILSGQ